MLPQKYSQLGPGIAVGDINGDDLEDFIVGAPKGKGRQFFISKNPAFLKRIHCLPKFRKTLDYCFSMPTTIMTWTCIVLAEVLNLEEI